MCTINVCPSCIPVLKHTQKLGNSLCASNNKLFVDGSLGGNEISSSVRHLLHNLNLDDYCYINKIILNFDELDEVERFVSSLTHN